MLAGMGGLPVPDHTVGHTFGDDTEFNGAALDSELLALRDTINQVIDAASGTIRDDKTLQDGLVRLRNLHAEVDTQLMKRHGFPLTDRYSFRVAVASVLANPPAEPADGDRYLIGEGAIGLWAGLDDRLVQWVEEQGEWVTEGAPQDGWMVWVSDPGTVYVYNEGTAEWLPDWGATGWGDIINEFTTLTIWPTGEVDSETDSVGSGLNHMLLDVELITAATSGWLTLEIFSDSGRTNRVWAHTWDLAAGLDVEVEARYIECETADTLYLRTTNNTGAMLTGTSWVITAKQVSLQGVRPSVPTNSTLGPGLQWVNGLVQAMTGSSAGTEVDEENRIAIKADLSRAVRILLTGAGAYIDGAMDLTTDQVIAGLKKFARLACSVLGTSGPPATTGRSRGELLQDVDGHLWHAIAGQGDGDAADVWALARPAVKSYPRVQLPALAANSIHQGTIQTLGNAGSVLRFRVWAWSNNAGQPAANLQEDVPFRLRFYPNDSYLGHEQLAAFAGLLRLAEVSTVTDASNYTTSWDAAFDRGGLIVMRDMDLATEEFARVLTLSGGIGLDEPATGSYAATDGLCTVFELPAFPFWSDSGQHNRNLYFELENDHDSNDFLFCYEAVIENHGHFGG